MALNWKKTARFDNDQGTTIVYTAEGAGMQIKSIKKHIPHPGREGTWDHTTFHVLAEGSHVAEKQTLKDAKEFAEWYVKTRG